MLPLFEAADDGVVRADFRGKGVLAEAGFFPHSLRDGTDK